MKETNETFEYTYSAEEQKEIRRIREKYAPAEASKMERLRKLDEDATKPGTIASVTLGVVASLVLGVGMSCTMVWKGAWFIPGIIIGIIGVAGIVAAYPLYMHITKKQREKIAPEVLRLTEELTK